MLFPFLIRSDAIGYASGSESRCGLRSGLHLEPVLGPSLTQLVRFTASVVPSFDLLVASNENGVTGLDTVAEQKKADQGQVQ